MIINITLHEANDYSGRLRAVKSEVSLLLSPREGVDASRLGTFEKDVEEFIDQRLNALPFPKTDWVVVGCESGSGKRPCALEWVESIVEQCLDAGVRVFVKQLNINGVCERDIMHFPPNLRIRQTPWSHKILPIDMPNGRKD